METATRAGAACSSVFFEFLAVGAFEAEFREREIPRSVVGLLKALRARRGNSRRAICPYRRTGNLVREKEKQSSFQAG